MWRGRRQLIFNTVNQLIAIGLALIAQFSHLCNGNEDNRTCFSGVWWGLNEITCGKCQAWYLTNDQWIVLLLSSSQGQWLVSLESHPWTQAVSWRRIWTSGSETLACTRITWKHCWLHGCLEDSRFCSMLCCHLLEILNFWTRDLCFPLASGPTNYVASLVWRTY